MSISVDVYAGRWHAIGAMADVLVHLLDDDPLALRRLAEALRAQTGYAVAAFATCADLLAAIDKRAPDVVVAHYRNADCDGLTALARVRERCGDDVVGLVMATYGDADAMRVALDAVGPLRVVNKPCDLVDLELKIRAGIEMRELRRELATWRQRAQAARGEATTATERLVEAEQFAAVGRVVSGIAHEIGTQLALVGYAEAIKSRVADDSELAEFADVIATAQKRLAAMVDEILDFVSASREPSGGRELAREPSDLAGVVDEALAILRYDRDVRERRIERRYRRRPLVTADRQKLAQVVINLVSNAALATNPGDTIAVEIDADEARGVALVTVADDGVGMDADVLARLGEPFFTTRGARGSGLGVGICKRIVEQHGGALTFESSPGRGTRATATLPLLAEENAA